MDDDDADREKSLLTNNFVAVEEDVVNVDAVGVDVVFGNAPTAKAFVINIIDLLRW